MNPVSAGEVRGQLRSPLSLKHKIGIGEEYRPHGVVCVQNASSENETTVQMDEQY